MGSHYYFGAIMITGHDIVKIEQLAEIEKKE